MTTLNTTTRMKRTLLTLTMLTLTLITSMAQCPATNNAFKNGERLTYDLYFNWKFIWIKCGSGIYTNTDTTYKGKKAWKGLLRVNTSKTIDKFFSMRDTMIAYYTPDCVPLFYSKESIEGGKHRYEEAYYNYSNNRCNVHLKYWNPDNKFYENRVTQDECIYDMLSFMAQARSYTADKFKPGQRFTFDMTETDEVHTMHVMYRGKENFKANDGNTYRCMVFTLFDYTTKDKGKERELIRFYFSDDDNHIPLRLDFYLSFGCAKALYAGGANLRHPVNSIVKKKK